MCRSTYANVTLVSVDIYKVPRLFFFFYFFFYPHQLRGHITRGIFENNNPLNEMILDILLSTYLHFLTYVIGRDFLLIVGDSGHKTSLNHDDNLLTETSISFRTKHEKRGKTHLPVSYIRRGDTIR